ncbi:MAG TPA: serine/threonine-protein kinase [Phycisphaerae bacterium]|nr:serine/threonine-protein kinase [Phycisphaerae bacterium]
MTTRTEHPSDSPSLAKGETSLVDAALQQMGAIPAGGTTETVPATGESPSRVPAGDSLAADIFKGYQLVRKIHGGGQGVVYQALQESTGKKVALKVFREGPFSDPRNRSRIELGVRILSELNHPNIVRIIDSGEAGGAMFYVMDYIAGHALDDWLERRRGSSLVTPPTAPQPGRRTSWRSARLSSRRQHQDIEELVRLFIKVCDAVNAAHLRGVIHRDLKPGNICIDERGEPLILDFDLAKIVFGDLDPRGRFVDMTQTGEFLGSLRWASPEQVERIPGKIDTRTDVYALGVILFEMLTGQSPYPVLGTRRDVEDRILNSDPLRPSHLRRQIDSDLDTIVLKSLSKQRERRYPSAGVLADDLRSFLAGAPISARRDSTWYLVRKLARRHALLTVMFSSVIVTLISATAISIHFYRNERQASDVLQKTAEEAAEDARGSQARARLAQLQVQRMALGWFLLEWHADRIQYAKKIRDQVPPGTAEFSAMQFLLDPTWPEERFLAQLAAEETPMGYFVVGERLLKAGRTKDAQDAYAKCSQSSGPNWYSTAAEARLHQLELQVGADHEEDLSRKEELRP